MSARTLVWLGLLLVGCANNVMPEERDATRGDANVDVDVDVDARRAADGAFVPSPAPRCGGRLRLRGPRQPFAFDSDLGSNPSGHCIDARLSPAGEAVLADCDWRTGTCTCVLGGTTCSCVSEYAGDPACFDVPQREMGRDDFGYRWNCCFGVE